MSLPLSAPPQPAGAPGVGSRVRQDADYRTASDIRALLSLYQDRRRASREVKRLALRQVAEIDRRIAELTAIREAVAEVAERCHGNDRPECPILDELGGLPGGE